MKNKLDWFDDNRNWDVLPTRMLYELLLSPTYRWPWRVKLYALICGVLSFHNVHGVGSLWSVSTNSFTTAAVKG